MADEDTTTAASTAELDDDDISDDIDNFYTSTPKKSSKHESPDNNNEMLILSDHQRRKNFKNSPSPINTQAKNRKRPTIVRFSNESSSRKKYQMQETGVIKSQDATDNNFLRPTMSAVTRSNEALNNRLHDSEMGKQESTISTPDEAGEQNSDSSNEPKSHVCMISSPHITPIYSD